MVMWPRSVGMDGYIYPAAEFCIADPQYHWPWGGVLTTSGGV